jgi:hypothetical protein
MIVGVRSRIESVLRTLSLRKWKVSWSVKRGPAELKKWPIGDFGRLGISVNWGWKTGGLPSHDHSAIQPWNSAINWTNEGQRTVYIVSRHNVMDYQRNSSFDWEMKNDIFSSDGSGWAQQNFSTHFPICEMQICNKFSNWDQGHQNTIASWIKMTATFSI